MEELRIALCAAILDRSVRELGELRDGGATSSELAQRMAADLAAVDAISALPDEACAIILDLGQGAPEVEATLSKYSQHYSVRKKRSKA